MAGGPSRPRLVADIGATNARFALVRHGTRPEAPVVLPVAEFATIEAAIRAALTRAGAEAPPPCAAVAIAAPVADDRVEMTNHPWRFSRQALRRALGLERLVVINDFTAVALSLPRLGDDDRRQVGGGSPVPRAPMGVLGPGTGLGVSGLVPAGDQPSPKRSLGFAQAGGWTALAGEGGHVDLAPGDDPEPAILERLRRRFGHVSLERALSGPGLVNLYRALAEIAGAAPADDADTPTAPEITARARAKSCPHSIAAVETFCGLLGAAAGDLALTLGARGGVYIAGGIVPRMGPAFDAPRFRRRFEAKGRLGAYLAAIPTYLVTAAEPALLGLAGVLDGPM
ncbi:MAG: glucokinase [Proteobacteria bacterium]|nr:glucokinase [Pseudomonadota bacterium]